MRGAGVEVEVPLQLLPEVGFAREAEAGRHDAHDRVRETVQPNRSSNDSRVAAEARLPQPVADDRFVFRTEQSRVDGEATTDCGLNSEHVEQVFRRLDR